MFKTLSRWLQGASLPTAPLMLRRLTQNPIIRSEMLPGEDGANINGPSLIRVPAWASPLGRYYLYFAHHHGSYIRLAFANHLEGPWLIHRPGTLHLADVPACRGHIASPDVHVDQQRREIRMYFHGPAVKEEGQRSFVAVSKDGLQFSASDEVLGSFYLRAVPWAGQWIAMAKGGIMYRSPDGLTKFEQLPFPAFPMKDPKANRPGSVRHVALHLTGSTLFVYYTKIGDAPESILRSRIDLNDDPATWRACNAEMLAWPEAPYEGANLPVRCSKKGVAKGRENALRDPAIFVEGDGLYLVYAVAGESGLALAELIAK